jgi:hypothetical protein
MTHGDEGTIVAMRDGAWTDEGVTAHVSVCDACAGELERARARAVRVAAALAELDDDVDVEAAKATVRRRLGTAPRERRASGGSARSALAKAAVLVLVAAGAVSALTWSPLRSWWRGSQAASTSAPEPPLPSPAQTSLAALAAPLVDGRIGVIVRGVPAGTSIDVAWVDGSNARISAPAGSAFTYAAGRAEVDAVAGPVRIELPRNADLASVAVDDVEYVRRSGAEVRVTGPAVERTEALLRFVVPQR